ncbi:Zn-dependent hydrolase [Paenibacillus caui]|uniref:Zn-dependent hydrolase n=1 Tax=Paenibacillus caui TaxID=2873927 RepID=UPI001F19F49F|nr:Zn-dependent hydrolase [Paenibacillus caui]
MPGDVSKPNAQRLQANLEKLSTFADSSKPGWTRRPFTAWYAQSRAWLAEQMKAAGLEVHIDAASNLIGRKSGTDPALPPILIGSHTDSVTGGGRFDGAIGVIGGIELAMRLKETGTSLKHTLEIIDFTAEEPSEFGISTIGSRGMVNNLPGDMLDRRDPDGKVLREAIREAGGAPEDMEASARQPGDAAVYLELHIEQGQSLETSGRKLAPVTGIVGILRYRVTVTGKPNHAGTTTMKIRKDALPGASAMILALEELCGRDYPEYVVGTVGRMQVDPNASNVIPGSVVFDLEIRSMQVARMEAIARELQLRCGEIAGSRGLDVAFDRLSLSEPIHVSSKVQDIVTRACQTTASYMPLPSGAGHDANQMALICPIGMIFVPSKDGRSHCPEEWTDWDEVALGVEALAKAVLISDNEM